MNISMFSVYTHSTSSSFCLYFLLFVLFQWKEKLKMKSRGKKRKLRKWKGRKGSGNHTPEISDQKKGWIAVVKEYLSLVKLYLMLREGLLTWPNHEFSWIMQIFLNWSCLTSLHAIRCSPNSQNPLFWLKKFNRSIPF